MNRGEAMVILGGWAADQWGLVTSAQAQQNGIDRVWLVRLTDAGLLIRVGHGIYQLAGAAPPEHLEIKVAWLRLDPGTPAWQRRPGDERSGVVSHSSACTLQRLGDLPLGEVELLVPRKRKARERGVRLRVAAVEAEDITVVDGLPVTTAERTIVDLLRARVDGGHVGGVIFDADQRRLIDVDSLGERVTPFVRAYGLPRNAAGADLIEHLVAQVGEQLSVQREEQATARAAERGFVAALGLMPADQRDEVLRKVITPSLASLAQTQGLSAPSTLNALRSVMGSQHMTHASTPRTNLIAPSTLNAIRSVMGSQHLAKAITPRIPVNIFNGELLKSIQVAKIYSSAPEMSATLARLTGRGSLAHLANTSPFIRAALASGLPLADEADDALPGTDSDTADAYPDEGPDRQAPEA